MPAKKKSKRTFGKGGKKPTINNPDTHHGTYDLPNASVRSYSEKAKPMKFAKGGFADDGGEMDDNAPLSRNNPSADMPGIPKAEAPKSKELSQADIDKMSYGEAFRHFRAKGAGTKFTYKGNKQAAYREGEEPESLLTIKIGMKNED